MTTLDVPLYKGADAEYEPASYPGENTSGLRPYGKNILIRVDACSPTSSGGIMHMPERVERMTMQSMSGCIYYIAPEAFRQFDDGTPWIGDKPKVGDRVCFEKYAGQLQFGVDGHPYRIMDYRSLACSFDYEYLAKIGAEAPGAPAIQKAS